MSADIIAGLIAVLKADAGVAALAGERIFGEELPEDQAQHMPRPCVVLQPSGGAPGGGGYMKHTAQRVDALSYGRTRGEASQLRRAVFACLKQLRRVTAETSAGGVLIHWVEDAGGYLTGRDPDADWPIAFQSFQAFYAEDLIAA